MPDRPSPQKTEARASLLPFVLWLALGVLGAIRGQWQTAAFCEVMALAMLGARWLLLRRGCTT